MIFCGRNIFLSSQEIDYRFPMLKWFKETSGLYFNTDTILYIHCIIAYIIIHHFNRSLRLVVGLFGPLICLQ